MGIAKTINAVGEYDIYSNDHIVYIRMISSRFGVNLQVIFVDMTSNAFDKNNPTEFFDFKFQKTYKLAICFYNYNEEKPGSDDFYCIYELYIPVDFPYEEELSLIFYPNGIFQLKFIPFIDSWHFFIEHLKGNSDHSNTSSNEKIEEFKVVRDSYILLLKRIDCEEVIIWTDANYKTEENFIFSQVPNKKNTLSEIKQSIVKLDNILLYDFVTALEQKSKFDDRSDIEIALFDKF